MRYGTAEKRALPALFLLAFTSVMTYAQVGPFVVQSPNDALPAVHNFAHFIERKHALTHPMKVYDVRLLKLWCVGYADAEVCDVRLPKS